jgi:gliding motility-associated lipoprotein GldH
VRYLITIILLFFLSCKNTDNNIIVFGFQRQEWPRNEKVLFKFTISDSGNYDIYFLARHTQRYTYNNLLCRLFIQDTASHVLETFNLNVPFANKDGHWMGNSMDDLYDHRLLLSQPVRLKSGQYVFALQHQMLDDPLSNVLNVGIEIEQHK